VRGGLAQRADRSHRDREGFRASNFWLERKYSTGRHVPGGSFPRGVRTFPPQCLSSGANISFTLLCDEKQDSEEHRVAVVRGLSAAGQKSARYFRIAPGANSLMCRAS
jgi:hypothetical protein